MLCESIISNPVIVSPSFPHRLQSKCKGNIETLVAVSNRLDLNLSQPITKIGALVSQKQNLDRHTKLNPPEPAGLRKDRCLGAAK